MLIDASVPNQTDQGGKLKKLTDTIDRLYRRDARLHLQKVMSRAHPADLAGVLGDLPEQHAVPIFLLIPDLEVAGQVFTEVHNRIRDLILDETPFEQLIRIFDTLPPDELTDLVQQLDPQLAERIMEALAKDSKSELENLLQYAAETAGGIMTTDYFALTEDVQVEEAVKAIRSVEDVEMIFYLYVTDAEGHLVGVLSLRQLLLAKPDQPLRAVMNPRIIKVRTDSNQEEVADLVDKYHLLAIPVVDESNLLLGMVTIDDVMEVIENETTRDMLKMAGTDESEILLQSPLKIARVRLPWLLAAFVGGLAATGVIQQFETILAQVLALSAFLPVIMGMAGNVGVQSATVAVRGLATGSLELRHIRSVLFKEFRVGLLLGCFYGIVLGLYGLFVFDSLALGEVVGLTILLNMTGAAVLAILLPMFFHRMGTDPAIATGPFVTTAIDVLGVLNYFAIASLVMHVV